MGYSYDCPTCGQNHDGLPDVGYASPVYVEGIPEAERSKRVFLTSDLCIIDGEDFFIRCVLLLPIVGLSENFGWGVWTTLSKQNFMRYREHFDEDMSGWEPMFGYLSNELPNYRSTLNLHLSVRPQKRGTRPLVTINEVDHPLFHDQQNGIPLEKALGIVDPFLHP